MAMPRKVSLVAERAEALQRQLPEAPGCSRGAAWLPGEARQPRGRASLRRPRGEEEEHPLWGVRVFCAAALPSRLLAVGDGCEEVYATRFKEYAEALVAADKFARRLTEFSRLTRWMLEVLEEVRGILQRL